MPGVWTDLAVTGRLGLREVGRRLRGEVEAAPDLDRFQAEMERALAAAPTALVAEQGWIDLPADEPPWRDTGITLRAGEEVSVFSVGRAYLSRLLDVWVSPRTQIWARIGNDGPIRSSSRDTTTLRAERDGRLYLGNYLPNDWKDPSGAVLLREGARRVSGGTRSLAVRWTGRAADGLAALARCGDPLGLVSSERERLALGSVAPPGWRYLWNVGEAESFRPGVGPAGESALCCEVQADASILVRDAPFPLGTDTALCWRWRVDALPGLLREDSVASHDYLSIAVEFESGVDLTYTWSRSLPPGTGYWCPLPNWKHREFHVVIRSGREGLGEWHAERRTLHADALHYVGKSPGNVVAVWLIAVSLFERQLGRCAYADIRLRGSGSERVVL